MRISDWSSDVCSSDLWGLIQVAEGRLRYCVTDLRRVGVDLVLTPERRPGVVEPTILHHVVPLGTVRFHVQFYRQIPDAAPLCRYEELAPREHRLRGTPAGSEPQAYSVNQRDIARDSGREQD